MTTTTTTTTTTSTTTIPLPPPLRRRRLLFEGSLEVKLPTIWTDEKQRWEESEKRKSQKKEDAEARKVRKVVYFSGDLWLRRVEK